MAAAATRSAQRQTSWLQRLENTLLSSGSRPAARKSPFEFGVVTASQFAPKAKFTPPTSIGQDIAFTIAEARERLREFIDGSYSPKRLPDLLGYLRERMLRLESRRGRDGTAANYLVDMRTNVALPAASVDLRLSRPAIARRFGNSIEAEAEAARRRVVRSPELVLAQRLRNANAGRFLAADRDAQPFQDWDDMCFSAPAMFEQRDIAAQGSELWVGFAFTVPGKKGEPLPVRASDDPEENLRIMKMAEDAGVKLVLPARTKADALAGRLTPGMPVLVRDKDAFRIRLMDPEVNFQRLTDMFGVSLHDHFDRMQKHFAGRKNAAPKSATVVDIAKFREQFGKARRVQQRPQPAAPVRPAASVAGAAQPEYIIRHEWVDDRESMVIVDPRTGQTYPFDPAVLGAGRFPKEDGFGLPSGYLAVSIDGGYTHYDAEGREHNTMGPAIVPPRGSGEPVRYAEEGRFVQPAASAGSRERAFVEDFRRADLEEAENAPVHHYVR